MDCDICEFCLMGADKGKSSRSQSGKWKRTVYLRLLPGLRSAPVGSDPRSSQTSFPELDEAEGN